MWIGCRVNFFPTSSCGRSCVVFLQKKRKTGGQASNWLNTEERMRKIWELHSAERILRLAPLRNRQRTLYLFFCTGMAADLVGGRETDTWLMLVFLAKVAPRQNTVQNGEIIRNNSDANLGPKPQPSEPRVPLRNLSSVLSSFVVSFASPASLLLLQIHHTPTKVF